MTADYNVDGPEVLTDRWVALALEGEIEEAWALLDESFRRRIAERWVAGHGGDVQQLAEGVPAGPDWEALADDLRRGMPQLFGHRDPGGVGVSGVAEPISPDTVEVVVALLTIPGTSGEHVPSGGQRRVVRLRLRHVPGFGWRVSDIPTMTSRWGDEAG